MQQIKAVNWVGLSLLVFAERVTQFVKQDGNL